MTPAPKYHGKLWPMILLGGALTTTGCTTHPDNIKASMISSERYAGLSCAQLHEQKMQTDLNLGAVEKAQLQARNEDTVGVMLVGVPFSRVAGKGQDAEIARLKGESQALAAQQKNASCS